MTAYDVAEWTDFANTVAGGAAALAGLLFVATPGQDHRALTAEIALIGVTTAAMVIVGARQQRSGPHPARALSSMLLLLVPDVAVDRGAVSLWLQRGGGLYWVTAAVATGFVAATANAWVLLVEIKR